MKKQLLFLFAALLPLVASAQTTVEIDGIWYNIIKKAKQAEVTYKRSGEYSGSITIPATVTYDGVECRVTSIENGAFSSCYYLTSITIPEGVTSIGKEAFEDCYSLTAVYISDIAAWCNIEFSSRDSNPLYYAHNLYLNGELLTELTIPEGVTSIELAAFYNCSSLTTITIPEGVMSIGNYAFYGCSSLTSITLPEGVTSIGTEAFWSCSSLTTINIPESVTSIGGVAFSSCSSLTAITIPEGVTSIENWAFSGCSSLTSITLPESVTSIGDGAFFDCSSLTSITLPEGVTSIGYSAFEGCSSLTTIVLPKNLKNIDSQAFANCEDLLDVYCYAEKVPSTKTDAFNGSFPEYMTLHVPANALNAYKTTAPWSNFGKFETLATTILVEGITLSQTTATMTEGETMSLTATVTPDVATDNSITWSSSNTSVATVDANGKVTAIVPGTATITATANDGSGVKALCVVTVEKKVVAQGGSEEEQYKALTSKLAEAKRYLAKTDATGSKMGWLIPEHTTDLNTCVADVDAVITNKDQSVHSYGEWYALLESTLTALLTNMDARVAIVDNCFYSIVASNDPTLMIEYTTSGLKTSLMSAADYTSQWKFVPAAEGTYYIQHRTTGKYISEAKKGVRVKANATSTDEALAFVFVPGEVGEFLIQRADDNTTNLYSSKESGKTKQVLAGALATNGSTGSACWAITLMDDLNKLPIAISSITLSQSSATMIEGGTLTLTATVTPDDATDKSITWSSSNPSVATVDANGKVTAKAAGTATITATANDGSGVKASCVVTVEKKVVAVSSITLSQSSATLTEGETLSLTATVTPDDATNKAVTWSSSNTSVATVDANGKVTAKAAGTATITATANDGSGVKASCVVTVEKKVVAVSSITLSQSSATLTEGETLSLTATVKPTNATNKGITWSSSNTSVATVDANGKVTAIAPGTATITATANDGSGVSASCEVTVVAAEYTITYYVDGEIYHQETLTRGTAIVPIEAPEKEGHTFSGWSEVPATMPAEDITITGTFTVNTYTVTFTIDGVVIASSTQEYGSAITVPSAPAREGYTFSGWGEVPTTMPASNVTYDATYIPNTYKVYYFVGHKLVHVAEVAYGEVIPEYIYEPTTEGDVFMGWIGDTYDTMPAHDVTYTANIANGIENSEINTLNSEFIYDLMGRKVTDTENLTGGVYIIGGKKVIIK